MAPIIPIGLLLGKADTAFRMVGGSSIVFNALRGTIFGKILRTIEYPNGDLQTIKIRRMNRHQLQSLIADAQPPPFPTAFVQPEDIQQIAVFTSPHFTEPVRTSRDVSAIPDNAWLFWSKESYEDDPIPSKGVKLDGSHLKKKDSKPKATVSDIVLQDRAIAIARRILQSSRKGKTGSTGVSRATRLSQWHHDRLVDLAVDRDAGLLTISRNFGDDEDEFARHARRLLRRRSPQSILIAEGEADDRDGAVEEEGTGTERKVAEAQPELDSRG